MRRFAAIIIAIIISGAALTAYADQTVKIKDIARIEGARSNQLVGYGLVVGLDGTGDSQQAIFTVQSVTNMLQKFGITVPASKMKVKNVATVMLTADLPPFIRPGSKIDIQVSSLGDAKSLQGGTLIQTPLQAANGETYAVAQGSVSIGGFTAGGGGDQVTKNHPTVGRIPNGAIVEQEVKSTLTDGQSIKVLLNDPDFATAARVAETINVELGDGTASALDPATIQVTSGDASKLVGLVARLGEFSVVQSTVAKVIVNERTGTVVIGGGVKLSPVALAHGNLSIEVSTDNVVSQPAPLTDGKTAVVPEKTVQATEQPARLVNLQPGSDLEDLVKALNELKVTPRDIIAILQALKQAGALHAELEII